MSILNNIEEISTFIVCPHCKYNSEKEWIICNIEFIDRNVTMLLKSHIFFKCTICNCVKEVTDSKLIKFVYKEIMKRGDQGVWIKSKGNIYLGGAGYGQVSLEYSNPASGTANNSCNVSTSFNLKATHHIPIEAIL